MAEQQTKLIKMKYSGRQESISCPADASYEDVIELAAQRFSIPAEFLDFLQILDDDQEEFTKDLFEYFILLFPKSEMIFELRVDYKKLMNKSKADKVQPLKSRKTNKHNACWGAPLKRTRCFIGTMPGMDTSTSEPEPQETLDEPKAKKQKTVATRPKEVGVLKTTALSKCIRI